MKKYFYIKSILDIILSYLLLCILLPFFLFIYILVLFYMGRPVLFRQERVGFNCHTFKIFKFRTMKAKNIENEDNSDFARITWLGNILRKLSIDELPQLINIAKGEMSFIGPRALLVEYLPLYSKDQNRRHNVKPGITGLAQVNGRNSISWKKRFYYDLEYVNRYSIFLDIYILLKTIFVIVYQKGINSSKQVTMEKFNGKN